MRISKEEAKIIYRWSELVEGEWGTFDSYLEDELVKKLAKYIKKRLKISFYCIECGKEYLDSIEGIVNKICLGLKEFKSHCSRCNDYTLFKIKTKKVDKKCVKRN